LRNRKNSGFIMTCNRGAKAAKGELIIFFNNDTLALPGWLPPLLRIFDDYPDAGAVGGKLVFPDGRLQEAGGVVFSDGSAANFGKWDYAVDAPLYNYVREVDYATGAFIATKRSLFVESGGFDTRFRPIYYEETDYCFRLREMGYRVYYQPESVIIHLEGATSGTDLSSGLKQHQVANRVKFVKKWERVLKRQPPKPNRFDFATWCALAVRDESEEADYL
jgi:GT2 family glycosyltransferase